MKHTQWYVEGNAEKKNTARKRATGSVEERGARLEFRSQGLEGLSEMALSKYLKEVREVATQLFGGRTFSAESNRKNGGPERGASLPALFKESVKERAWLQQREQWEEWDEVSSERKHHQVTWGQRGHGEDFGFHSKGGRCHWRILSRGVT